MEHIKLEAPDMFALRATPRRSQELVRSSKLFTLGQGLKGTARGGEDKKEECGKRQFEILSDDLLPSDVVRTILLSGESSR